MSSNPFSELVPRLPDEFSKTLLAGAIGALKADNPLRAHHFATSIRELISRLLHIMAPDDLVMLAPWYRAEADRPTRRQRATFAVQGGLTDAIVESLGVDISDMQKRLKDTVVALNKNTHVREDTLLKDQDTIEAFATNAVSAVLSFFDTIDELRTVLGDGAVQVVGPGVFEEFIETTVDDLDILSTHTQIEGVQVDDARVVSIGLHTIQYKIEGTVYVQLVWGSGSDFDRGDGATQSEAFPFTCSVEGSLEKLDQLSCVSELEVDTSSWFE
jgi:molybdopterin converting factor small subunit